MPIGNYYFTIYKNKIIKKFIQLLGIQDLHSHIRLKPMIDFFRNYFNNNSITKVKVIELGCGSGVNAFEIYKIAKKSRVDLDYIGVDLSFQAINIANNILNSIGNLNGKISFYEEDANMFLKKHNKLKIDVVLLMDIIEHIKEPKELLRLSKECLNNDGLFIVSVPTPTYPRFFGSKFSKKIGHLVNGYSLEMLDELFNSINCERMNYKFNTGIICNMACWLYYNKLYYNNKYFNILK